MQDEPTAPVTLRPPRRLVSSRAKLLWTIRAVFGWAFLVVPQVVLLIAVWGERRDAQSVVLGGTLVLAAVHATVMPRWRYRVHRWEVTDLAVYTQAGWVNQERRIAPTTRIQTVDTQRGPLEQLLGLMDVRVTTASAAGPLRIRGLARADAEQLAEQLTETTQAARDDAT